MWIFQLSRKRHSSDEASAVEVEKIKQKRPALEKETPTKQKETASAEKANNPWGMFKVGETFLFLW